MITQPTSLRSLSMLTGSRRTSFLLLHYSGVRRSSLPDRASVLNLPSRDSKGEMICHREN